MSAIILDTHDYQLSLQNGLLRCFHPDKGSRLLPWHALSQIVVGHGVQLDSDVLINLAEKGIELLMCGSRMKQQASLLPLAAPSSDFKLTQYALFSDREQCQQLAILTLRYRNRGQLKNLHRLGLAIPQDWHTISHTLIPGANSMMIEAALSQRYWAQLATLLSAWGFNSRERRPPNDPINALLSLTSTLEDPLYGKALLAQGFDIGLGFHHATGYYRQSLIYDIKELTRADLELWTINLFRQGQLTVEHFQHTEQGCRLTASGQRLFYPLWFGFCRQHKKKITRLARFAKRVVLQKGARHG